MVEDPMEWKVIGIPNYKSIHGVWGHSFHWIPPTLLLQSLFQNATLIASGQLSFLPWFVKV